MAPNEDWAASLRRDRTESRKSWGTALWLSILGGVLGCDRFYLGRADLGLLKIVTLGGLCAWWFIDIALLLQERMKDGSGRVVRRNKNP